MARMAIMYMSMDMEFVVEEDWTNNIGMRNRFDAGYDDIYEKSLIVWSAPLEISHGCVGCHSTHSAPTWDGNESVSKQRLKIVKRI